MRLLLFPTHQFPIPETDLVAQDNGPGARRSRGNIDLDRWRNRLTQAHPLQALELAQRAVEGLLLTLPEPLTSLLASRVDFPTVARR